MNRHLACWALLAAAALFSCGGGRTSQAPSEPLAPADKALTRGVEFYREGCYERSLESLLRAHELYTAADARGGIAMALNNIGNVYRARKDPERSLLYYDAAADIFSEIADPAGHTRAMVNQASALIDGGRLSEAERILAAARAGGESDAFWLLAQGNLLLEKKAFQPAAAALERALEKAKDESPEPVSGAHFALARLFLQTGRPEAAVTHAEAALAADRNSGAYRKIAEDLMLLGASQQAAGRKTEAGISLRRAMNIYALLGDADAVAESARRLKETGAETVHPVTVGFIEQWLKGDVRSNICR